MASLARSSALSSNGQLLFLSLKEISVTHASACAFLVVEAFRDRLPVWLQSFEIPCA